MRNYSLLTIILICLSACSGKYTAGQDGKREEIVLNAEVSSATIAKTKADVEVPFEENFDLFIEQAATPKRKVEAKFASGNYTTGVYWDNIGGHGAELDLLGVYPKTSLAATADLTDFEWKVKTNQSAVNKSDFDASNLTISERMLTYKLATQKANNNKMKFHHMMAKITINLVPGDGFVDENGDPTSDFNPTVAIVDMFTTAKVNALTRVLILQSDMADITPFKESQTNPLKYSAIVMPGKAIATTDEFVKITMNGNTYVVKLENALTLGRNQNHVFQITIKKSGVELQGAVVVQWEDNPAISSDVRIGVTDIGGTLQGNLPENDSRMYFQMGTHRISYTYDNSAWKQDSKLYWDDIVCSASSPLKVVGLLYNTTKGDTDTETVIKDKPEHIYVGNTTDVTTPVNYVRFSLMEHPFSKINLTVRSSETDEDRVDVEKLTEIKLLGLKRFDQANVDKTSPDYLKIKYLTDAVYAISSPTVTQEGGFNVYKAAPMYVEPVKILAAKELVNATTVSAGITNTYLWKTTEILDFKKNNEYDITVTLKKTSVAINVSVKPWVKNSTTIGGEATIDK